VPVFVLHVTIKIKAGQTAAAEQVFAGPFRMAITAQPGFRDVQFLRPGEDGDYVLSIAFENQAAQQQWVATDLHGKVWGQMEQHFDSYSLNTFTTV
jgi:heme-degrading monooxygenase HmoA